MRRIFADLIRIKYLCLSVKSMLSVVYFHLSFWFVGSERTGGAFGLLPALFESPLSARGGIVPVVFALFVIVPPLVEVVEPVFI